MYAQQHPPPPRGYPLTPSSLLHFSIPPTPPLPEREAIRAIHVYDFDNTLFQTPLPNPKIWHGPTLQNLQSQTWLANGGWWHDPRILASTGDGLEVEATRAWEGWWNENLLELVKLSMRQTDALCVLLTGRSMKGFAGLVKRMVESRGLRFDLVVLKPEMLGTERVKNTIGFKCQFLDELLNTYSLAEELKIYEDRINHVRSFEDFCSLYIARTAGHRARLTADVIQVSEETRSLKPTVELASIQSMVHDHNALRRSLQHSLPAAPMRIKKTVFYTGYLLKSAGSAEVINALNIAQHVFADDMKLLANSVLITPRPASGSVLKKTGALGRKVEFEVIGVGHHEHRVWAALVKPVDPSIRIYTDNPQPVMVLAVHRNSKPIEAGRIETWLPPPRKGIRFDTVIGEHSLLRIEEEGYNEGEWESLFPKRRQSEHHHAPSHPQHQHPAHVPYHPARGWQ